MSNTTYFVKFIVADIDSTPIIGLNTSMEMILIKRINEINKMSAIPEYVRSLKDCFGPIGCLKGTHHIVTSADVQPVVHSPRRIPISLQGKLYNEILRMIKLNIIVPVHEPTEWVNSIVAVEKLDGSLRLCLDPQDLNKAIKRPYYNLPTTEELLAQMSKAKYFTKLDASCAYWQIQLDYESSKLLTFNSLYGRFRFLRMAYGIKSASDVCQYYISNIIEGLDGVVNSQDDIIIWGETMEELKKRTIEVSSSIRKHGLKLNRNKCRFNQSELIFLGHKVTGNGVYVDDKKIEAIIKMPYPRNVKELQRFLGTINYLGKFIPMLSEKTVNLRRLLEKGVEWSFDDQLKTDVDTLKKLVTAAPVLKFFDQHCPTQISCDASMKGLGAVLEQKHDET